MQSHSVASGNSDSGVCSGRGIKPRTKLGVVDNIDVAPTVMAFLGENLAEADGKVLREIFDSKQQ